MIAYPISLHISTVLPHKIANNVIIDITAALRILLSAPQIYV